MLTVTRRRFEDFFAGFFLEAFIGKEIVLFSECFSTWIAPNRRTEAGILVICRQAVTVRGQQKSVNSQDLGKRLPESEGTLCANVQQQFDSLPLLAGWRIATADLLP
jgi:hypothetical protein